MKHKHADIIKAWADGAEIEFRHEGDNWQTAYDPAWVAHCEYRVKPAAPAKVYPTTKMSNLILSETWVKADIFNVGRHTDFDSVIAKAIADAALRSAIDSQQVVPMAEVQEVARNLNKSLRVKERLAVAEAVRKACARATNGSWGSNGTDTACKIYARIYDTLLDQIIATVE